MKNYYRVMLGKGSVYADKCFAGNFIGADFEVHQDLAAKLPDDWRSFNREFIPVFMAGHPGKSKIGAGLACGALWTIAKGIQKGDIVLCPDGKGIQKNKEAVAETIENNVRKLIIDESPINPKYYEKMSELLDALIKERRAGALEYAKYLAKIVELTKQVKSGPGGSAYPQAMNTSARRALYDNLGKNHVLALAVDGAVKASRQDDWRGNAFKIKKVRNAIKKALQEWSVAPMPRSEAGQAAEDTVPYIAPTEAQIDELLELVTNQHEY